MLRLGEDNGLPLEERCLRLGKGGVYLCEGVHLCEPEDKNWGVSSLPRRACDHVSPVFLAYLGSVLWPSL